MSPVRRTLAILASRPMTTVSQLMEPLPPDRLSSPSDSTRTQTTILVVVVFLASVLVRLFCYTGLMLSLIHI